MNVTDLCGAHLCVNDALCSYLLRGVRVYLCTTHLRELGPKTGLSLKEIAEKLPEFVWIGSALTEKESA